MLERVPPPPPPAPAAVPASHADNKPPQNDMPVLEPFPEPVPTPSATIHPVVTPTPSPIAEEGQPRRDSWAPGQSDGWSKLQPTVIAAPPPGGPWPDEGERGFEAPVPRGSSSPSQREATAGHSQDSRRELSPSMSVTADTFIGDNPFQVDDSVGPDAIIPGWLGVLVKGVELFNTFAGPEAYGRYLTSQPANVFAKVEYSYAAPSGETIIEKVAIENGSSQPIKVQVHVKPENSDNLELPLTWIKPGTRWVLSEGLDPHAAHQSNPLAVPGPPENTEIEINIYAIFNNPAMIRAISLWLPADRASRYVKPVPFDE